MNKRQRTRLVVSMGLAVVSALLVVGMLSLGSLGGVQNQAADWLFKSRPSANEPRVVIAAIDEKTLAGLRQYGRLFTWPRNIHAEAINRLKAAGARVIVLDVLFDVPAPGDAELAQAMQAAGNVVSPVAGDSAGQQSVAGEPLQFAGLLHPLPALLQVSADIGHANQHPDADGTIRRVPLVIEVQDQPLPALPLKAVGLYLRNPAAAEAPIQDGQMSFLGRSIPVDEFMRMRVNYLGQPASGPRAEALPVLSYLDVLQGNFDPEIVRDKIVFIGTTAAALADDYWVPTSVREKMDGVEIHSHAAATILRGEFIRETSPSLDLGLVVGMALLVGLLLFALSPVWGAAATLALALGYALAGFFLFDSQRLILNFAYPYFAMGLSFGSVVLYRVLFEQREQRALQKVFATYVPPSVAADIAKNPDSIKLGGERREISVLFTDLKGFTNFSETVEPEVLSRVITQYLNGMTRVIFENQGTVDKYIGDAVMAFWNAPQDEPDHARRACETALAMQRELARLGDEWQKEGLPRQYMRVGVNSGMVSVGNMGSNLRMSYTAFGDTVNLGARLEPLNNEYGTWVGISENTLAKAGEGFFTRYLDLVAVKGKTKPVAVFELIELESEVPEAKRAVVKRYLQGIELYQARRFREAEEHFQAALELDPKDGPSAVYLERCRALAENPPPEDWDGVFVMHHK